MSSWQHTNREKKAGLLPPASSCLLVLLSCREKLWKCGCTEAERGEQTAAGAKPAGSFQGHVEANLLFLSGCHIWASFLPHGRDFVAPNLFPLACMGSHQWEEATARLQVSGHCILLGQLLFVGRCNCCTTPRLHVITFQQKTGSAPEALTKVLLSSYGKHRKTSFCS